MGRAAERGATVTLCAGACEGEAGKRDLLLRHGFALRADVWNVYLTRPLDAPPPAPPLPAGYSLRPLAGEGELESYEAVFSFAPMSRAHRLALLRDPGYLHLVI